MVELKCREWKGGCQGLGQEGVGRCSSLGVKLQATRVSSRDLVCDDIVLGHGL